MRSAVKPELPSAGTGIAAGRWPPALARGLCARCRAASSSAGRAVGGCTSGSAAATPTTPTAYVATGANVANPGDTVAVVDTVTSRVADADHHRAPCPPALAVTPDGPDVLVANKGEDTVSEIDVASGSVVGQATVGPRARRSGGHTRRLAGPGGQLRRQHRHPGGPALAPGRATHRGGSAAGGRRRLPRRDPGAGRPTTRTGPSPPSPCPSLSPGRRSRSGRSPSTSSSPPTAATALVADFQTDDGDPDRPRRPGPGGCHHGGRQPHRTSPGRRHRHRST